MELKLVSEDHRRKLFEFGNGGNWKVCKILEAKENCVVGNHFHKQKDEMFVLLSGSGEFIVAGNVMQSEAPFSVFVSRGNRHTFTLSEGSILLCLASEEHNPNDDFKE